MLILSLAGVYDRNCGRGSSLSHHSGWLRVLTQVQVVYRGLGRGSRSVDNGFTYVVGGVALGGTVEMAAPKKASIAQCNFPIKFMRERLL